MKINLEIEILDPENFAFFCRGFWIHDSRLWETLFEYILPSSRLTAWDWTSLLHNLEFWIQVWDFKNCFLRFFYLEPQKLCTVFWHVICRLIDYSWVSLELLPMSQNFRCMSTSKPVLSQTTWHSLHKMASFCTAPLHKGVHFFEI
jgi:hypothetical protein